MNNINQQPQQDILHIKQMMERSSRFISLSGLSGIAAGICALIGAYAAKSFINNYVDVLNDYDASSLRASHISGRYGLADILMHPLSLIAFATFFAAFVSSFIFTYLRSKKTNTPLWGNTSKRLFVNVMLPLAVGGLFILKLITHNIVGFIAPACLIFYGLALLNASKYTLIEIKYLGYGQIILGLLNLSFIGYGLTFWAIGFGILHIVYGFVMWFKYERNS